MEWPERINVPNSNGEWDSWAPISPTYHEPEINPYKEELRSHVRAIISEIMFPELQPPNYYDSMKSLRENDK